MKFKKLIGKITAFVLAGTMMFSSTPVYADTAANSGADVFATQSSNFTIRIPKQLVLSGNEGTGAYRVAVKGNIAGTDIITVTPDADFYMKQEGKSDILATITQPKTDFTYADGVRPEAEVISDGIIEMASISAGKWSGLFNFTVTSSVDLSLEDSTGSDKADINGNVVGGDVSQDKHSEYDVINSDESVHTHTLEETIQEPTCTETGLKTVSCSECVYSYTETIDALEHDYETSSTASSCTEEGYTTYTCSRCGDSYVDNTTPALGHSYGEWETIKEANCTENGLKERICICGDTQIKTIPMAHNIVAGECTECDYNIPGLYDENGALIVSWEDSGISDTCYDANTIINETYPSTTKVIISEGVTLIENYAFCYSERLTSVIIPDSVVIIGGRAFDECKNLASITIPNNVVEIGYEAFHNCTSLTSITIPESVTKIDDSAFSGCTSLTNVTIPNSVTTIGTSAFSGCTSLTNVTIPNSVTTIGASAFSGCTSLASITIPDSVTIIGDAAFSNCESLTNVYFENSDGWYVSSTVGEKTTALSSSDLSNPSTAATYLKNTYAFKYWSK